MTNRSMIRCLMWFKPVLPPLSTLTLAPVQANFYLLETLSPPFRNPKIQRPSLRTGNKTPRALSNSYIHPEGTYATIQSVAIVLCVDINMDNPEMSTYENTLLFFLPPVDPSAVFQVVSIYR